MKIIVTHASPDWDAITSTWLIKKFLPGWESSIVKFVPAGSRLGERGEGRGETLNPKSSTLYPVVEAIDDNEVIHVDTGLGPLDHHQTSSNEVSAAWLTWKFVKTQNPVFSNRVEESDRMKDNEEAIDRMVKIVVDTDHFREVFWKEPTADYHEFSLLGLLDGVKFARQNQDGYYIEFGIECLEALLHQFENRIWAEKEIAENGKQFKTSFGKGIAFETLNDTVLKLAQKMGYILVARKDPRKGYIRIKARPCRVSGKKPCPVDLTKAYQKLKKLDPEATWFLHVSKHMLLNGTPKNPKMKPTKLSLDEIVKVLETI